MQNDDLVEKMDYISKKDDYLLEESENIVNKVKMAHDHLVNDSKNCSEMPLDYMQD